MTIIITITIAILQLIAVHNDALRIFSRGVHEMQDVLVKRI